MKRIICAGGYRTGSTWQYNVTRTIFDVNSVTYICGDPSQIEFKMISNEIIKSHNFNLELMKKDTIVLTTIRDLRDVVASAKRRNMWQVSSIEKTINFLKQFILSYELWKKHTNLEIRYEDLYNNKIKQIEKISETLMLPVDCANIYNIVESIEVPKDKPNFTTHLWPNHITNGIPGTYEQILTNDWIKEIEKEFYSFILKTGYPIKFKLL